MNKPLSILVVVLSFCGCHPPAPNPNRPPGNTTIAPLFPYGHPILLAYDQYIATLDTQKIGNGEAALQQFRRLFDQQPPDVCDTAFYIYDRWHSRFASFVETHPPGDSIDLEPLIVAPGVLFPTLPPALQKIWQTLTKNGLRVYEEEGLAYITRDWHFMAEHFSATLSPAMQEYLVQEEKEDRERFQDDAAISITPVQLSERAVWWEQFARRHPQFLYTSRALDHHAFYVRVLLTGMDNTPVTRGGGGLADYYETAYDYIGRQFNGSETNAVVLPYYKAWQKKDTAEVRVLLEDYLKKHPF